MQRTVLDIMIRWCGAAGVAAFPGAALATLVLGFILLGEGLQELLKVEGTT